MGAKLALTGLFIFIFLEVLVFDLRQGSALYYTGALPLEPHLQSFLLWVFGNRVSLFAQASLDNNLLISLLSL
jgi:hypothetical protein